MQKFKQVDSGGRYADLTSEMKSTLQYPKNVCNTFLCLYYVIVHIRLTHHNIQRGWERQGNSQDGALWKHLTDWRCVTENELCSWEKRRPPTADAASPSLTWGVSVTHAGVKCKYTGWNPDYYWVPLLRPLQIIIVIKIIIITLWRTLGGSVLSHQTRYWGVEEV